MLKCTGCGSTQTIEEIKADHPEALSCCPERDMQPELVTELRDYAAVAGTDAMTIVPTSDLVAAAEMIKRLRDALFYLKRAVAEEVILHGAGCTGKYVQAEGLAARALEIHR